MLMATETLAASSRQTIEKAKEEWNRMTTECHFLENHDKEQHVVVGNFETMAVLASFIPGPLPFDDKESKATKRLEASAMRFRKVSFLPFKHQQ